MIKICGLDFFDCLFVCLLLFFFTEALAPCTPTQEMHLVRGGLLWVPSQAALVLIQCSDGT